VSAQVKEGRSSPLGATVSADGTNFSVYSKHAKRIELLLFDCVDDARPERAISTEWEAAEPVPVDIYHAESRSMVMLFTGI